jgi:hypothetical protein
VLLQFHTVRYLLELDVVHFDVRSMYKGPPE